MLALSLSLTSPAVARRSAAVAAPVISIVSGGGYAGSVYRCDQTGGQWHADDSPMAGETAQDWIMTPALEGASITYRKGGLSSNAIEMWMPDDLPADARTNGGWWDPKRAVTTDGSAVTALPDLFGVRPLSQSTGPLQPAYDADSRAIVWPNEANRCFLAPNAAFAPAYWMFVSRYLDGTASAFQNDTTNSYVAVLSNGTFPHRVMGQPNTPNLSTSATWAQAARKNAASSEAAAILPLPKSLLEMQGTPASAAWSLGRGASTVTDDPSQSRAWRGAMFEVLALGTVPDDETRAHLQGCVAWRNGLQDSLPSAHPFRSAGPRRR